MKRLNPFLRGAAPGPLITAVDLCVVPVATFWAEVWWPGKTHPTLKGNVSNSTR